MNANNANAIPEQEMFALIRALWQDLQTADFYWVLLALAAVLGLSAWIASRLRRRAALREGASRNAWQSFGAESARRLAFPLVAMVLVFILRKTLVGLGWQHVSVLQLANSMLAAWAIVRFAVYLLRCVFSRGGALTSFERGISITIWGALALDIIGLADPIIGVLGQLSFTVGKQELNVWMILHGSVAIGLTLLIALWIASLVENRLMAATAIDSNVREVLVRIAKGFLLVVTVLMNLSFIGIDITTLSVFGGALMVGLGFGLQKIASNYVSGFIILLDRSIRIGNLLALDDRTSGTVTQITTRYTVVRMLSGTEIIIPNEHLVSNMIRNLTFTDTRVRFAQAIQVGYGTDLERAMEIMVEAAKAQPRVLETPGPGAMFIDFGDNGITLEVGFWLADPEQGAGGVRSAIAMEVWKKFKEEGIEIPYPQREVRILNAAPEAAGGE